MCSHNLSVPDIPTTDATIVVLVIATIANLVIATIVSLVVLCLIFRTCKQQNKVIIKLL